ncbi:MAG: methylthioribulose 1-phosphate dehydratase [Leptospiraceae bacterium]|nr:methylthioribulose 1-phosphate dehydratase [Leptospiraceae bacterium]MCP5511104.1 methylthioribulose 1-phosphate dehydratase [Leptospiraceae bacterium]
MPATAGNLSFRGETEDLIRITASGRDKGRLSDLDFLDYSLSSRSALDSHSNLRPSAETIIHSTLYQLDSGIGAILHVHTLSSCVLDFGLSRDNPKLDVSIPNLEILKAFGDFREEPDHSFLSVYNFGNVESIAEVMRVAYSQNPPQVPFFLIQNHGITVWGKDVESANKHLEAVDFVLKVMERRKNL